VTSSSVVTGCYVTGQNQVDPLTTPISITELYSAPKTATKRVFLITDEDNPHPSSGKERLTTSARTTLVVSKQNTLIS
jgi:hypothetical protein